MTEILDCSYVFELSEVISTDYLKFEIELNEEDIENLKKGKDRLWNSRIYEILQTKAIEEKVLGILKVYNINIENLKTPYDSVDDYIDYCDDNCNCSEIEGWIDKIDIEENTEKITLKVKIYSKP
jgi:hypothetical protein